MPKAQISTVIYGVKSILRDENRKNETIYFKIAKMKCNEVITQGPWSNFEIGGGVGVGVTISDSILGGVALDIFSY